MQTLQLIASSSDNCTMSQVLIKKHETEEIAADFSTDDDGDEPDSSTTTNNNYKTARDELAQVAEADRASECCEDERDDDVMEPEMTQVRALMWRTFV